MRRPPLLIEFVDFALHRVYLLFHLSFVIEVYFALRDAALVLLSPLLEEHSYRCPVAARRAFDHLTVYGKRIVFDFFLRDWFGVEGEPAGLLFEAEERSFNIGFNFLCRDCKPQGFVCERSE